MTISDAEFDAWLETDAPIAVLVEQDFGYQSAGAPAVGTIYLADRPYTTRPTDTPASVSYHAALIAAPKPKRSIPVAQFGGRSALSVSPMRIANHEGEFDYLLDKVVDGYENRVYIGAPTWARADFRLACVSVAETVEASGDSEIVVQLREKRLLLDREIKGDAVGGSGPNATKYLPLLWGSHKNVEALVYDTTALTYAVVSNYDAASKVADVRDKGVTLRDGAGGWSATAANTTVNAGTDTFTKTGNGLSVNDVIFFADPVVVGELYTYWAPFPGMSARPYWVKTVPTADTFTLSATKGGATLDITGTTWSDSGSGFLSVIRQRYFDDLASTGRIQLSSTPDGMVTVDLLNRENIISPFALIEEIIGDYGNVDGAEIDSAAFTAADTALDAKIALGYSNFAVMERRNLIDALDDLARSCFGWYGVTGDGLITCGVIDISGVDSLTPEFSIEAAELIEAPRVRNIAPTISRVNVMFDLNAVAQPEGLAASVSAALQALYSQPFRQIQRSTAPSGTAYSTNKPAYHRTMTEGEPRTAASMNTSAFATDQARPIANYADEIVADLAPHVRIISAITRLKHYEIDVGKTVLVTYPRFGMSAGKNAIVTSIEIDFSGRAVSLELLTRSTPDVTTASHY